MKRIFPDYTYGIGPRRACWWDETIAAPHWPPLAGDFTADVAVIGGGFTGISAALRLAEAGHSVIVCEAGAPGWGASGRNGGFCCLGGGKISSADLTRVAGADGLREYRAAEHAAVDFVAGQLRRFDIDADTHSHGETLLAHTRRAAQGLAECARSVLDEYGVPAEVLSADALPAHGLGTGFFGAVTTPVGFALNPRKYLFGIARAAHRAGVRLASGTEIGMIRQTRVGFELDTGRGQIRAERVIVATNAYSNDDLPNWMAARYMPAQSSVLVTRELTRAELEAQGWTSRQMCYDSRDLLHYFRLMPDNRFLFGARGGLVSSPRAEAAALACTRRDFEAMFPAWAHVDTPFGWSGMVCLARNRTPYVGPAPDMPGVFAAFAYHGNGVAMGSYCGHLLAGLLLQDASTSIPAAMARPARRFPFGRFRRIIMPPLYLGLRLGDLYGARG